MSSTSMDRQRPGRAGAKTRVTASRSSTDLTQWTQHALAHADDVHPRKMFGCPAFFTGRRMFACVYEGTLGLKLPEDEVPTLVGTAKAHAFRPYGKPKMRAWCALLGQDCNALAAERLLLRAFVWARMGHRSPPPPLWESAK